MAQRRESFEILGARLYGPAPIADVWVPWRSGVSALYGLNGAGKTRVLQALSDLYQGVRCRDTWWESSIILRLTDRVESGWWSSGRSAALAHSG